MDNTLPFFIVQSYRYPSDFNWFFEMLFHESHSYLANFAVEYVLLSDKFNVWNKPTNAGILLVGKNPLSFFPKSYIALGKYKGKAVGEPYQETDLESAAFLRPIKKEQGKWIEYARNPISAVLLCPFGTSRPNIVGVLHPNPNFLFDRKLLPKVKFGKLKEGYKTTGILQVEWI